MAIQIIRSRTVFGSAPGKSFSDKVRLAALRSLRTLLQGIAAALLGAGAGTTVLSESYWQILQYSLLLAVITAIASFLQNIATFLPDDPTQSQPTR